MSNFTPANEPETDNDALLASEEEDLSSGNGRLAIIVGAIVLFAGLGYAFVPAKTAKSAISSVVPSIMLGDATVTGSRPEEEKPAEEATEAEEAAAAAPATATVAARPVARPTEAAAAAVVAAQPAATEGTQPEAAPVPEAAAPAAPAEPSTVTLSGRILDENGRPLAGATVLVKGSRKGTGTDANGNYTLEVPSGDNTLVYGYGGYQDQEMRAKSGQPLNVTLTPAEGGKRRRR